MQEFFDAFVGHRLPCFFDLPGVGDIEESFDGGLAVEVARSIFPLRRSALVADDARSNDSAPVFEPFDGGGKVERIGQGVG